MFFIIQNNFHPEYKTKGYTGKQVYTCHLLSEQDNGKQSTGKQTAVICIFTPE